ncbi:MAG TPA: hypothetical protein VMD59_15625 [Acidimicrobiales bacterium]|nr:hypothetical protein [Acidimicrobiales bacterium]
MTVDPEGLIAIRASLEADGYAVDVVEGERVGVVVSATPQACEECLVPPAVMISILEHALKVPADRIDLTYPEGYGSAAEAGPA